MNGQKTRRADGAERQGAPRSAGVKVTDLSVVYEKGKEHFTALANLSFDIEPGEFVCLVGPSGCGKTSLLNILAGFLESTTGTAIIGNKPVGAGDYARGVVFQEYALFPWRTALSNVEFGMEVRGISRKERRERAQRYLEMVGLGAAAQTFPHELSGGMKQRVAIARALAFDPDILLMDEPFGALDAFTRDELQRMLATIWQETGKTVVYVTHNISEAVYLADRIFAFASNPGRLREIVAVDLPRPRDTFSAEFASIERYVTSIVHPEELVAESA